MSQAAERFAEHEAWLAEHAVEKCQRYDSRISKAMCERYQLGDPARCLGCEKMTAAVPPAEPGWLSKARQYRKRSTTVSKHRKAACGECGKERLLPGRGLCSSCLTRTLKKEKAAGVEHLRPGRKVEPVPVVVENKAVKVPVQRSDDPVLTVVFTGEDQRILHALHRRAVLQRRSVENELLALLETALEVEVWK